MGGPLSGNASGIIIPTLIQTSSDLLRYITSLTCLYDVNWAPDQGVITLPIAMFRVTKMHEIGKTNISTKRVILYEPQENISAEAHAQQIRPSVLRAITDNAVRDPKQYTLDVVLPFTPIDRGMMDFASAFSGAIDTFAYMLGATPLHDQIANFVSSVYKNRVATANEAVQTALQLPNTDGLSYVNKISLETMWKRSHFLVMKMWTGMYYEFVMISDMDISKEPKEDDVFRGSLRVQEMPVLCVNKPQGGATIKMPSSFLTPLSTVLDRITGVDQFGQFGGN